MTLRQHARYVAFGAIALVMLAGCGQNPYGVDAYGNPIDPYGYGSDPYGYGSDPYGSDPYGSGSTIGGSYGSDYGSGSYGSGYGSGTTGPLYGNPTGGTAAIGTGELKVGKIDKDTKGFWLWKKLTVSSQVSNPSQAVLSGEIMISFMKGGKVVETQTEFVTDLAPGQAHTFNVTSKKAADDAEISVISKPGQAPASGYGNGSSGYGTGTGYGSSTGSGYGSGYDTGYGSSTGSGYGSGYDTGYGSGAGTGYGGY